MIFAYIEPSETYRAIKPRNRTVIIKYVVRALIFISGKQGLLLKPS